MIRKHSWWVLCAFLLFSTSIISWKPVYNNKFTVIAKKGASAKDVYEKYVAALYEAAHLEEAGLNMNVFEKAVTGYLNLKSANKLAQNSSVITVVDFSKPSREKRMWLIDLFSKKLLLNTWVAHGEGSGDDLATRFSDNDDSHQSSLGFYLTDDVYIGKHGRSLHLDGLDEGFNISARARDIVLHAAKYVGQGAINEMGRLGHSFGCPAVAPQVCAKIINLIKGRNLLFISGNDSSYTSKYLNEGFLANFTDFDPYQTLANYQADSTKAER